MQPHISVVSKNDDEGNHHTFLRLSQPGSKPFERELTPYEMTLLSIDLTLEIQKHMQHKEYAYHNDED